MGFNNNEIEDMAYGTNWSHRYDTANNVTISDSGPWDEDLVWDGGDDDGDGDCDEW